MKTDISTLAPNCLGLNRPLKPLPNYECRKSQTELVARINAALGRLDDGQFGLCVKCGEPITLSRLDDDPAVTRCSVCSDG